jgi:hypothetical protein
MAIMELRLTATGMMSLARGIAISVTSTMTVLHITLEMLTLSAAAKLELWQHGKLRLNCAQLGGNRQEISCACRA